MPKRRPETTLERESEHATDPGELRAAIDIGSATIHLLIGSIAPSDGGVELHQLDGRATLLGLGADVAIDGQIDRKTAKKLTSIVRDYVAIAGRSTPWIFPILSTAAPIAAPELPADTMAWASPLATRAAASTTEAFFLARRAEAGDSPISIHSGASRTETL